MSDKSDSSSGSGSAETWPSPSEALTRFVPSRIEQSADKQTAEPIRFGARVGNIGLLVPKGMLSELVEEITVYPLPTTPPWFQGLINLRGSLVPVFDLKALFKIYERSSEKNNLLVLNTGEKTVGILIDGLPVTLQAAQSLQQGPLLPPVLRDHHRAVYAKDAEVWVDFDFDGFFQAAGRGVAV
jgi:twitching motility protein PilI